VKHVGELRGEVDERVCERKQKHGRRGEFRFTPSSQQWHHAEEKKEERCKRDRAINLSARIERRRPSDIEKQRSEERDGERAHPRMQREEHERRDVEERDVSEELRLAIDARR